MTKVSELSDAQDVLIAVELAKLGASVHVIEGVTGFGSRWARRMVKENKGAGYGYRRKEYPAAWFDRDPERILHGWYVVSAFIANSYIPHYATRLMEAYMTYRLVTDHPVLGINESFDIIDLYQQGNAWIRTCTSCHATHLVVSEHSQCPVCRRLEMMLCKGCGAPLPEKSKLERRGRKRIYCDNCETTRSSRVLGSSGPLKHCLSSHSH